MVYSITLYFLASYLTPLAINPPISILTKGDNNVAEV